MYKYTYIIHDFRRDRGVYTLYEGDNILREPLVRLVLSDENRLTESVPTDLSSISLEDVKVLVYYDEGLNQLVSHRAEAEWAEFVRLWKSLRKQAGNIL